MANGNFGGGDGTDSFPFLVEDAADLDAVRTKPRSSRFRQVSNIDMSSWGVFEPIGPSQYTWFSGIYDGAGYTINNLSINSDAAYVGLFFILDNGRVKNLGLVDANVVSTGGSFSKCGALTGGVRAGSPTSPTFENCYATGSVNGLGISGGLCGGRMADVFLFLNCYSNCSVAGGVGVGGLVGEFSSSSKPDTVAIDSCYSSGVISGGGECGGVVGSVDAPSIFKDTYSLVDEITRTGGSNTNFGKFSGTLVDSAYLEGCYALDSMVFRG